MTQRRDKMHFGHAETYFANSFVKLSSRTLPGFFLAAASLALACATGPLEEAPPEAPAPQSPRSRTVLNPQGEEFEIFEAGRAPEAERTCAWYADTEDGVIYFGESSFWEGVRETGLPTGALDWSSPQRIGRFSLRQEKLLAPLELTSADRPAGVWDVFAHPDNGRVYFTVFFGDAGYVDVRTGRVVFLPELGRGLNEWAPGPNGSLLVSRYAEEASSEGSVLMIDPDGKLLRELPLDSPAGYVLSPKTIAYDAGRGEIWATTDMIPRDTGPTAHPTIVLDALGRQVGAIEDVEIHFVRFGPDGTGYFAVLDGSELRLAITAPGGHLKDPAAGEQIILDSEFEALYDFAQQLRVEPDGRIVVTRWSGRVHVVSPDGAATLPASRRQGGGASANEAEPGGGWTVQTLDFPEIGRDGLYYGGGLHGERVCVTHCADVAVVCGQLPALDSNSR